LAPVSASPTAPVIAASQNDLRGRHCDRSIDVGYSILPIARH
jgi:hypothetical protein